MRRTSPFRRRTLPTSVLLGALLVCAAGRGPGQEGVGSGGAGAPDVTVDLSRIESAVLRARLHPGKGADDLMRAAVAGGLRPLLRRLGEGDDPVLAAAIDRLPGFALGDRPLEFVVGGLLPQPDGRELPLLACRITLSDDERERALELLADDDFAALERRVESVPVHVLRSVSRAQPGGVVEIALVGRELLVANWRRAFDRGIVRAESDGAGDRPGASPARDAEAGLEIELDVAQFGTALTAGAARGRVAGMLGRAAGRLGRRPLAVRLSADDGLVQGHFEVDLGPSLLTMALEPRPWNELLQDLRRTSIDSGFAASFGLRAEGLPSGARRAGARRSALSATFVDGLCAPRMLAFDRPPRWSGTGQVRVLPGEASDVVLGLRLEDTRGVRSLGDEAALGRDHLWFGEADALERVTAASGRDGLGARETRQLGRWMRKVSRHVARAGRGDAVVAAFVGAEPESAGDARLGFCGLVSRAGSALHVDWLAPVPTRPTPSSGGRRRR